jgi:hypothetical protein
VLADELGEEFVRNAPAIGGQYLYLFAKDEDIAYRDERTWSFCRLGCQHTLEIGWERGTVPIVVLRDDVVSASEARGRGKLDRFEIPNLLMRGLQCTSSNALRLRLRL